MSCFHRPFVSAMRARRHLAPVCVALVGIISVATPAAQAGPAAAARATLITPSEVLAVHTANHHGYHHGAVPRKTRAVAGVRVLGFAPRSSPVRQPRRRVPRRANSSIAGAD